MKIEVVIALALLLVACRVDPVHPAAADVVGEVSGESVGSVDGRAISVAEVEAFASSRSEPVDVAALVARERRAYAALRDGADVRLARKQAMVRALLADEIEGAVPVSAVPAEELAAVRKSVEDELRGFSGVEVFSLRIAAPELLVRNADVDDARRQLLADLIADTAEQLYEALPEHNALETAMQLDLSTIDEAIRVERLPALKLVDPTDGRDVPRGWVRAHQLYEDVAPLAEGDRAPMRVINGVPVILVRKNDVVAEPLDPEHVATLTEARAVADRRRERFDALLTRLRTETPVAMRPKLLQEVE